MSSPGPSVLPMQAEHTRVLRPSNTIRAGHRAAMHVSVSTGHIRVRQTAGGSHLTGRQRLAGCSGGRLGPVSRLGADFLGVFACDNVMLHTQVHALPQVCLL